MNKGAKIITVIMAVIVLLISTVGLILAVQPVEKAAEPKLSVDLTVRPEIVIAAYKIYGDPTQNMWAARTIIKNTGEVPITNFKIKYKIDGYCDWTSTENYPEIVPGETVRDYCTPSLDPDAIDKITTKTTAELTMLYEYDGLAKPMEDTEKLTFLGKNDFVFSSLKEEDILTWQDNFDNYPMLAAFVTPNEETTKSAANAIAGGLVSSIDNDALLIFERAFDALRYINVKYIIEPQGYWTSGFSQYVQYPKDTLTRGAGTCLDLSILMAALMEAVGIKSYIYLTEGHAQPAIQLPESGKIVPIEATFIDQDFALSHYPGETTPEVTSSECINSAIDYLNNAIDSGKFIKIDIQEQWKNGVVPSW
jgi:hypothetical protein